LYQAHTALEDLFVVALDYWGESGTDSALSGSLYQVLKHLHNVETHFQCPRTFLSLGFQCTDEVFEVNRCFGVEKGCYDSQRSKHRMA